jgi:hypothetical protein
VRYLLFAILFLVAGCARMFACTTDASFEVTTDPATNYITKKITYSTCKEQIGLEAEFTPDGNPKSVKVDKSGTQEAVIAATSAANLKLLGMLEKLQALKPDL